MTRVLGDVIVCIVGCSMATMLPRVLPLMFLSVDALPAWVSRWLSFVPVAVMAALLFPEIFMQGDNLAIHLDNIFLVAAIPTLFVSWRTGSFFGTIACGMGCVAFLRFLGW